MPLLAYALLRVFARVRSVDAVAVATAFGSVSRVTFATGTAFLQRQGVPHDGWFVCGEEAARRIVDRVKPLLEAYAGIVLVSDVQVTRDDPF